MNDATPDIHPIEAIPAATLVIFCERPGDAPELLMIERAKAMAFAGGATVFPGGRVDPDDRAVALTLGGDPDDGAARIAAIRETIEETGIAIGLDPPPSIDATAAIRVRLHGGEPFGAILRDLGHRVVADALVPFARWLPTHRPVRVFDTRFYLACLPEGAGPASIDHSETTHVAWMSAQAVLDAAQAGRATIIYPTRRNLERLSLFASFDDAVADANAHPVRPVIPRIETRDGQRLLCIPDDLGYPVTTEPLDTAMRG